MVGSDRSDGTSWARPLTGILVIDKINYKTIVVNNGKSIFSIREVSITVNCIIGFDLRKNEKKDNPRNSCAIVNGFECSWILCNCDDLVGLQRRVGWECASKAFLFRYYMFRSINYFVREQEGANRRHRWVPYRRLWPRRTRAALRSQSRRISGFKMIWRKKKYASIRIIHNLAQEKPGRFRERIASQPVARSSWRPRKLDMGIRIC